MPSLKRALALITAAIAGAFLLACGTTAAPEPPVATVAFAPAAKEPTATAAAPPAVEPTTAATAPAMVRTTEAPAPASPTETPAPASSMAAPPTQIKPTEAHPTPTETLRTSPPPANTPTIAPTATDAPAVPVGTEVGEMPPPFAMARTDGTRIASADLSATGRPVFMHYFATW